MSSLEKRKIQGGARYRLRDRIDGKMVPIIYDLGIYKEVAEDWRKKFDEAVYRGFRFTPPITITQLKDYLEASRAGLDTGARSIPIEELCDLWLEHHGPTLKDGVSTHYASAYMGLKGRLGLLKRAWKGRLAHTISYYDVGTFLAPYAEAGTKLRYIGCFGAMFKGVASWNRLGNILPYKVHIPSYNPFTEYRAQLPPAQKLERPRERVLEPHEWDQFKRHLTPRARAICETNLRRFLRRKDIKGISGAHSNDHLVGIQQKTGLPFKVPSIKGGPDSYDFTNFPGEFKNAQIRAEMNWPKGHPLHFTFRDLRRTGATWALRAGERIEYISAMLGHRKISTTQRYLRIDVKDLTGVAEAVDRVANAHRGPIKKLKIINTKDLSNGHFGEQNQSNLGK